MSYQIKSSVTMIDVCHEYGIAVNISGFACCPFHAEKTASMKIYQGDRGWHCFGCGEGGSVIDFVMKLFSLDYVSACRKMNEDFGLQLPLDREQTEEERVAAAKEAYRRRQEISQRKKAYEDAIGRYYSALSLWIDLDTTVKANAPTGLSVPISDEYATALKRKDYASYLLDAAANDLYLVEQRRRMSG